MELEHTLGKQFFDDEDEATDNESTQRNIDFEITDPVNTSAEIEVDAATDNPFAEKTEINSTALIVEGRKLYVSKHLLSIVSPVFRSMFSLEMQETHMDEIPLPGKRLADMVEFLRCVYPDKRKTITVTVAETLVPLFEEYQIADLKEICERAISESCTVDNDIDAIFTRLLMACTYNMDIVKAKCIELASNQSSSTLKEALEKYEFPLEVTAKLWELVTDKRDTEISSLLVMFEVLPTEQAKPVDQSLTVRAMPSPSYAMYQRSPVAASIADNAEKHVEVFKLTTNVDDVEGSDYIMSIQRAMKYEFHNILQLLVRCYAAKLHSMEFEGFLELQNSGLSDQIKHKIFQKILHLR